MAISSVGEKWPWLYLTTTLPPWIYLCLQMKQGQGSSPDQTSSPPSSTQFCCMLAPHIIRGGHVPVAIPKRQHERECKLLGSFWLTQYSNVIPDGFVPCSAYSHAILQCKQFLLKVSCYENTTLMGRSTALTWFQKHRTTEAHTKNYHHVLRPPLAATYSPEETQDQVLCGMDLARWHHLVSGLFYLSWTATSP